MHRLSMLLSRTREVEQQMISNPQPSNTADQPTVEHPMDSVIDPNEALRRVLARREQHQARYPVEELAKRMEASRLSSQINK